MCAVSGALIYTLICKPSGKVRRLYQQNQQKNQGMKWRPATRDVPKEIPLGDAASHRSRVPASGTGSMIKHCGARLSGGRQMAAAPGGGHIARGGKNRQ